MRFDLTDLRLFIAVADAGSITHGAAAIGLSLAAASERLRDMEAVGEVQLLERRRHGVTLTAAGDALTHHARLILRQMDQMRSELGEHARGLRATVRLAANTAAITGLLPERLAPWMAANPRVDVDLKERQSAETAKAVASGLVELGILTDVPDLGDLQRFPFATDQLVMIAKPDHVLAGKASTHFRDIVHEQFIGLADGALQQHVEAQAQRLGIRLAIRLSIRTFEGMCRMAAHGVGVAIMPETAARRWKRETGIIIVPLADDWAMRRLVLCVRSQNDLPLQARALLDHLRVQDG